jgi:L-seryl-tRNA(Ser) seleniumtransferase
MSAVYKALPPVEQVLQLDSTAVLLQRYRRAYITDAIRRAVQRLRDQPDLLQGEATREAALRWVEGELAAAIERDGQPSLRRVINATGVILHTGLGRAPLPAAALEAVREAATHYCNLELDLASGQRGSRISHVEELICRAAGAEAATVVNNNAAAVLLMLNTLARDRQVIVSRGELVEIGGSFRVPDIIAASGAEIREVGTTNRTHLRDYQQAITPDTAAILVVHPSNYRVQGFTARPELEELVELSRKAALPLVYDLGGGVLAELEGWGLPHEPVVDQALQAGVDLVSFSGDKVLGGPQAGIIAGRRKYIQPIIANPLMRTLRCDKLILAALEACLRLYRLSPEKLQAAHPVLRMMTAPVEDLEKRAQTLLEALSEPARQHLCPALEDSRAQAGSGTLPLEEFPSRALVLTPRQGDIEDLARRLRLGNPSAQGRIHQERLLLDMRTVRDDEVALLSTALNQIAESWPQPDC